jgi:hypothetical protein
MKAFVVGVIVGALALGALRVLQVDINLVNYITGYIAGSIAVSVMLLTQKGT